MLKLNQDIAAKTFTVTDDDKTLGVFKNQSQAFSAITTQLAAIPENGADVSAPADLGDFEITFLEGEQSVDERMIDIGATRFDRPTPLPLMWTNEQSERHMGSVVVGKITSLTRVGTNQVVGRGKWDSSVAATEAKRMVEEGMMIYWSPDLGDVEDLIEVTAVDEEGYPTAALYHVTDCVFCGGTMVPVQALNSAIIRNVGSDVADIAAAAVGGPDTIHFKSFTQNGITTGAHTHILDPIAASAKIELADLPSSKFFEDPELSGPTPLTITDDGRIFGHIATWDQCHIGREGCLTAPHSASDYAYFRTGHVETAEGDQVATGVLTLGTGHADIKGLSANQVSAHYDNTGTGVADVAAGEDMFGIWVSGSVRPTVTSEQLAILKAAAPSGDWRTIAGNLELVAALMVNVPGFPVPQTQLLTASGECQALVAAGTAHMVTLATQEKPESQRLEERIAVLEAVISTLAPAAVEALDARMQRSA